jgi:ElaB/YqjD/DUF883 family membrane-anchored ribosome-binding protein
VALTSEDMLKLNVMLHSGVEAIRIDEGRMILHALSGDTESRIDLHANCRADQYLKQVRELISGHVLGSPGGYPVFLRRWTRMGQARDEGLAELLMLGEPEAVVAVSNAPGLSSELARRAWWIDPSSENARRMLANPDVAKGEMGPVLAQHLVEHLAFETEPQQMIDTVRLVLQPDLIDEVAREKIWTGGARRNAYRVGFLQAIPDDLPETAAPRAELRTLGDALDQLVEQGNDVAAALQRTLDDRGQTYLRHAQSILRKPANQDVVVALLNTIGDYFAPARVGETLYADMEELAQTTESVCQQGSEPTVAAVLERAPELRGELSAMLMLAGVSEALVTSIFAHTTAEGTLMRRKLEPVTGPLFERIDILLGEDKD